MEEVLQKMANVLESVVKKQAEIDKRFEDLNSNKTQPDNQPTAEEIKSFARSSKS